MASAMALRRFAGCQHEASACRGFTGRASSGAPPPQQQLQRLLRSCGVWIPGASVSSTSSTTVPPSPASAHLGLALRVLLSLGSGQFSVGQGPPMVG